MTDIEARLHAMEARLAGHAARARKPAIERTKERDSRSSSARGPTPVTNTVGSSPSHGAKNGSKRSERPLSAPLGAAGRMQVLDGEAGYRVPSRNGSAGGRSRAQPSPRRTDTRSLQVRRRGDEPSIPDVSETGLIGQLPYLLDSISFFILSPIVHIHLIKRIIGRSRYIKVERPSSAQLRAAELREFGLDAVAAQFDAAASTDGGQQAKVEAEAAATARAEAAAGRASLETRLAEVQRNQRRRELEAYMEELQEKAESGAVELPDNFFGKDAEVKFSARGEEGETVQAQRPAPEPEPEPEPKPEPEAQAFADLLMSGTMTAATELDSTSIDMDNAADPADMDELDRRLRALQATQNRRRGELDAYMSHLQSRKVEDVDGGGVEDLVSFPAGFEDIVQSLEREALERPWLSYLQGGGTDGSGVARTGWEGDEEESEEQRKVRKGYERMAKLDSLLSEKTKAAQELAWRREQERWLAESSVEDGGDGDGQGQESGYRNAALVKFEAKHAGEDGRWAVRRKTDTGSLAKQLEASMSDTADKMLRRTLEGSSAGKNVYSRYLTLTEEQEERVAALLEADDPDPAAIEAAIYEQYHADHARMTAIDQLLSGLRRPDESREEVNEADGVSTSPSRSLEASSGAHARHLREVPGADADANRRANDFLKEQREARATKAKTNSLDAQLRKLHTEAAPEAPPWADDASVLAAMLADAEAEVTASGEVQRLTDEQVMQLCKTVLHE